MNRLYYILFILILFSCGESKKNTPPEKLYFDFDEIIHYEFDITEEGVMNLSEKRNKTRRDSLLENILIQYGPDNTTDTAFLNSLESLSQKKKVIDTVLFKDFRNIFKEKKHPDPIYASCMATWRDILIFKKAKVTTGIAKICFGCDRNRIAGTTANTEEFGQSGDYKKLFRLLYKK